MTFYANYFKVSLSQVLKQRKKIFLTTAPILQTNLGYDFPKKNMSFFQNNSKVVSQMG